MPAPASTTERPLRADARRNRDAILAAARALVAERGATTQMQDVADAAGVGIGTVYRHFPTKDALMGELLAQCALENAEMARRALELDDPWESFAAVVRGGCDSMDRDVAKRRIWQVASVEAYAHADAAKAEMHDTCREVIGRAQRAGVLRDDFDVADMAGVMSGLGAAIDAGQPGGWKRLVEFALDGLRARR